MPQPNRESSPAPPCRVSLPAPLVRVSLPAPPYILSLPAPPLISSLPPLPSRVSLPPAPSIKSSLSAPGRKLSTSKYTTMLAMSPPRRRVCFVCLLVSLSENESPVRSNVPTNPHKPARSRIHTGRIPMKRITAFPRLGWIVARLRRYPRSDSRIGAVQIRLSASTSATIDQARYRSPPPASAT